MTGQRKAELIGAGLFLLLFLFLAATYIKEREARVEAEANAKAQDVIIADRTAQQKDRDAALVVFEGQINAQIAAVKTPQQAATVIKEHFITIPGAPATSAPAVVTKEDLAGSAAAAMAPESANGKYVVLSDDAAQQVAKQQLTCDLTTKSLTTCTADLADEKDKLAATQIKAEEYRTALKGGTWLHRVWTIAKPVGCATGGAAAGAYIKGTQGAAIGAIAAGLLCAIATR